MDGSPGVQTILGQAGACPIVEWAGKRWKIGHPTQGAKAILEELCAAQATQEITRQKRFTPAQAYAENVAELGRAIRKGEYRTWHPGWTDIIGGLDGDLLFLMSLMVPWDEAITLGDVRALHDAKGDEVHLAVARVTPPFFDELMKAIPKNVAKEDHPRFRTFLDMIIDRLKPTPATSPA